MVRAPAGYHAGPELLATQPAGAVKTLLRMHAHLGVIDLGRGPQPCVVVEVGR